jgi:CBS domain-containing protein
MAYSSIASDPWPGSSLMECEHLPLAAFNGTSENAARRWLRQGGRMATRLKTPEELLAYRPLKDLLAAKPAVIHSVGPDDSVYAALERMAEHGIGFLVVLHDDRLAGVFSERDYARKVILQGKASSATPVRDVMTSQVVTVTLEDTVTRCMALMNAHGIRHLPVLDQGRVVGVVSVRDVLKATVEHHERLIRELELERMTLLNPNTSGY